MDSELQAILLRIEEHIAQLQKSVQALHDVNPSRPKARPKKPKPAPLTATEIATSQELFVRLFDQWMKGFEIEVHDELRAFELERLRQFCDANNLNITAKMSKDRMLELISARFREKRQLHKQPVGRGGVSESGG